MSNLPPFRFGIINEHMQTAEAWYQQARQAEEYRYSTFLIRDHFAPDFFGDQFGPLTALMAAASVTSRLRFGTLVIDNDYRHPVMLAKEAATLDLLSGGRLELGLGAGWLRSEYQQAGMQYDPAGTRIARLEEAIQVIKGLFADGPFSFSGTHYTIEGLNGYPKPAQRPGPPLLIGAGQRRMLMLAGREAGIVGILTTSVGSGTLVVDPAERLPESVAQKVEWVRQGAGERFEQIELSLVPTMIITNERRRQTEQYIMRNGWSGISIDDVWSMPSVFIGSIEQICDDMQERRERYGFSYYIVSDDLLEVFAPVVERLAGK